MRLAPMRLAQMRLALTLLTLEPAGATTAAPATDANGVRAPTGKHAGAGEDLAQVTPLRPARHESPDVPAARGTAPREAAQPEQSSWRPPETDAIDLLDIAGLPVLKRAVPAAAAVLAVILVLLGIRRRRRSRKS